MKRSLIRISALAVLAALALLSGCSVNPVTGKKELSLISEAQEIQMGQQTDVSIRQEYGIYRDQALNAYLDGIGKRMAPVSHRPQLPYHFSVLDTPVENAFAAPGGYIYVTRGMMALMEDEAALAGIVGHEMGHVNARHTARAMSRQIMLMGGVLVASVLSEDLARIAPLAMVGMQVLLLKYSRDDEYQADSLGVQYSRKIGYAPGRVIPLFTQFLRMEQSGQGPRLPNFLSTHPLTTRRIEELDKMLEPGDVSLKVNRPEYLRRIDGMIYGENPRQGFVEGGMFYHPELQFAVCIPQGWKHQNTPQQLVMVTADEKAGIILAAETTSQDLGAYLQAKLQAFKDSQVKEVSRSPLRINGLSALRGLYSVQAKAAEGQEPAAPTAVDIHCVRKGGQIFTLLGTGSQAEYAKHQSTIQAAIQSFQPLTDPSKINRQPLRISLQAGRKGEVFQSALQRLSAPQPQWKGLSLMNGLQLTDTLASDRVLKVVR